MDRLWVKEQICPSFYVDLGKYTGVPSTDEEEMRTSKKN